jgi:hypothetical protein
MQNLTNLYPINMKKIFSTSILLIIILLQLSAQKTRDAVYLKNGSIIYGNLTEIQENQYKIKGSDGSLFIFPSEDVEKFISDEPVLSLRKSDGFAMMLEGGFLIGSQTDNFPAPFSFNVIGSYTLSTRHILGLGTGAEFIGKTYTPVFLEYKALLSEKNAAPFIFIRGGMVLSLGGDEESTGNYYPSYEYTKDYSGGGSMTVGTGISWAKNEYETYLSFAYRYLHTSYVETNYNNQPVTYENNYNRLEIKFGFKF